MFRITRDPLSGSSIQCVAKSHSDGSVMSVDICAWYTTGKYTAVTPTTSISTDMIEPSL